MIYNAQGFVVQLAHSATSWNSPSQPHAAGFCSLELEFKTESLLEATLWRFSNSVISAAQSQEQARLLSQRSTRASAVKLWAGVPEASLKKQMLDKRLCNGFVPRATQRPRRFE
eukprot:842817-Amphidinium_carterae.2